MTHPGDDAVFRIVHTSDWHLGCPFKQFRPSERSRLRQARRSALEHVFGEARRADAHVVLCAGDLFDDHNPTEAVWRELSRILRDHAGSCSVVLLPGNHDPLLDGAIWHHRPFRDALPDFVHVVDRDDFELELPEGARLYSCPTRSRKSSEDPILKLPGRAPDDDKIRVALVHGQALQFGDQAANHPVDPHSAEARGFDYVALGDTHGFRELTPDRPYSVVYSGTPEQMSFKERDAGHIALVHIRRRSRRARVQKKPVGSLTWTEENLDSEEAVRALLERDLHDLVLRLRVTARLDPEAYRDVQRRLDQLEGDDDDPGLAAAVKLERELTMDDTRIEDLLEQAPEELKEAARLLRARRTSGEVSAEVVDRAMARLVGLVREATR